MGAPKGNQYAKGHGFGRPPIEYSDEELLKLGEEMLDFYNRNPDMYFLQEFAIEKLIPFRKFYEFKDRKVFVDYYETAKNICAARIAKGAGKEHGLNAGIAQRFLNVYFSDVKDVELEIKKADNKNNGFNIDEFAEAILDYTDKTQRAARESRESKMASE